MKAKDESYFMEWYHRKSEEEKKAHNHKRYMKYKERYNKQSEQWGKDNPEASHASTHQTTIKKKYPLAWENTDIVTADLRDWLKKNKRGPCPYCSLPTSHIDHIVPLAKGGDHRWGNIELTCSICNIAKKDRDKSEYIQWIKQLVKNFGNFPELSVS